MDTATLQEFLGWCALINIGLLLYWWLFLWLAHDLVYRMHSRFFRITEEHFDSIHYAAIAWFKLTIFVFVLVPYVALRIIA